MRGTKYWHLIALLRNERRSLDELLHRQVIKLRRLLSHAYNHVPFYREKFNMGDFQPGDFNSIDDIQHLPIISKADFHQRPLADFIDQRLGSKEALIPIRTSGSSGQTLEFFIDHAYDQFRKAQFLRPYMTNGQRMTDRVLTFKGQPRRHRKYFEFAALLREKQVSAHLNPESHLEILNRMKPAVIRGYPSVLALISAKMSANGPPGHCPRRIFTDSELLTPTLRRSIETAFKRQVIDIYGTLETDNIAYQCEHHQDYHIAIDAVIMEFINNGRPVQPGVTGEIVCTVLGNYAMPFIRYRLNDFGIYSDQSCACGRSFPLMTGLKGRTHDYAVTLEGRLVSSTTLLGEMDRFAAYVEAFQIIQEDTGRFKMVLIPGKNYQETIADRIQSAFMRLFPEATIQIECRERLHQEGSGKIRPFISRVSAAGAETVKRRNES
jgi:phenylacetate-CoA ligase